MKPWLQVFRKELREMLRDKRVRSSAFFGPMFLIVMLVVLLGNVMSNIGKPENQRITVVATNSVYVKAFEKAKMNVEYVMSFAEGRQQVAEGKARVVLEFASELNSAGQLVVKAAYDPKNQLAQVTVAAVEKVIQEQNRQTLGALLVSKGIPTSSMESVKLVRDEVKVGGKGASEFIVGMLPYLIVIWAFYGGFGVVSDLVAGEKEKLTLETLLISPVPRTQIVFGKFLSLASICLMSSLSSLLGIVLVSVLHLPGTDMMFKDGLGVTPLAGLLTVAVLVPTVAFFASILIAVSTYARNPREAQTHLTLISFVVIMPAIFSQFIGLTDAANAMWVNFVPVLNTANTIRMALLGKPNFEAAGITIALSAVLAAIALRWAIWLFNREQVLTRV